MWYRIALVATLASDACPMPHSGCKGSRICAEGWGQALQDSSPLSCCSWFLGCPGTWSLWFIFDFFKKMSWVNHFSLRNMSLAKRCHSRGRSQKVHGRDHNHLGLERLFQESRSPRKEEQSTDQQKQTHCKTERGHETPKVVRCRLQANASGMLAPPSSLKSIPSI